MSIQITYNEKIDQFTNDITLESRLKRYINNNFYPIFIISTLAKVYLFGE